MEVKNLFKPGVKDEIITRIHKLSPESQRQWGKMNVSQMLAHVQMPMGAGIGIHKIPRSLIGILFGRMIKPMIYNDKPFKQNLPTDKSFVMTDEKDFEKEKKQLLDMLGQFKEENIVDRPHPIFGKLTKEQWSKGTWKHLDHHLQQFGV
jgi:hypothetical protein